MTVLIAGAGPVGLTLATFLGKSNVPVVVFEIGPGLNQLSQASTFHASTLELLDEIAMAWPLIDTGKATQRLQYRDRAEGLVAEFDYALLRDVTRFPIRLQTDQSELTRLLLDELRRRYPSVDVRFGSEVLGARQDGGAPVLSARVNGVESEFAGRFVIGAEGAHSAIRHSLGNDFVGSTYLTRHLMITTSYDVVAHMPEVAPVTYVFDGEESVGLLTLKNVSRVVFLISGDVPDEEILQPENLQRRLASFLPPQRDPYPIIDARIARLHQRVAERYSHGSIAIAGDAAHLNHPLGGMGLNAGIHDAYVLANVIREAIACGNRSPEDDAAVLSSYGQVRREQALLHIIPTADSYAQVAGEDSAGARKRRNEEMRATASDPARARQFLLAASMFDSAPKPEGRSL